MTTTAIGTHELPTTIRTYLAADAAGETEAAARTLAPDVVVTDQGHTYRGRDEVHDFLAAAGSEFTFTTTLVGAERVDDDPTRWVALQRLEGDFPGGVADLRYRFTLVDDLVTELHIAP